MLETNAALGDSDPNGEAKLGGSVFKRARTAPELAADPRDSLCGARHKIMSNV